MKKIIKIGIYILLIILLIKWFCNLKNGKNIYENFQEGKDYIIESVAVDPNNSDQVVLNLNFAVDCDGDFVETRSNCENGQVTVDQTYTITTPAVNGGLPVLTWKMDKKSQLIQKTHQLQPRKKIALIVTEIL